MEAAAARGRVGLSDPAKKDGNGTPAGGGTADVAANERLNAVLLAIIEREIGRAEPRRPADWQTLEQMAVGHESGAELVATFKGVIDRCNEELVQRFGAHGVDLSRLRDSVVMLIRVSLARKLGLSGVREKES